MNGKHTTLRTTAGWRFKFIGYVEMKEMYGAMAKDVEIDDELIAEAKNW